MAAARKVVAENTEALKRSEGEKEALRVELEEVRSWEEAARDRLKEIEHEKAQLEGEVMELRTSLSLEKKQKEDLQLCLIV